MHNDGKLTQETFAIAMHLINGKLAGKPLPDRLPETLIPPSQRQSSVKPAPPVSQIHRDLFELENSPSGSPTVPEQPTATAFAPQRSLSLQNTGASGAAFPPLSAALTGSVSTSPPPRPQQQSPFAAQGNSFLNDHF
jgi:epidermal growth factor receptor substrate 15